MGLENRRKPTRIGDVSTFITNLIDYGLGEKSNFVFYFRGHSDREKFELKPSLYRNHNWMSNEHLLFREIMVKCPDDFHRHQTTFEKLVKMQHYSLPTRLLDLTGNPLSALYFAVKEFPDLEGEVIIFKVPKDDIKYYDSDSVSILSNISKMPKNFDITQIKSKSVEEFNMDPQIKSLLHEIKKEIPYFESKIDPNTINAVLCVKSKLNNPRIIRQDGAFFLFGINNNKLTPSKIPTNYMKTSEDFKFVIFRKDNIKKQLSALGINDATMFPEIESVAKHLKDDLEKRNSIVKEFKE
jgi:hypothetical protein